MCQNTACITGSFLLDYRNRGCLPEVKQQIIDMSLNASGVRDTARSQNISPTMVLSALRNKEVVLESVNTALLCTLNPETVTVDIERAGEAEMDEMWSFVGHKGNPRWLWHTIDHGTGAVLAYVFGSHSRRRRMLLKINDFSHWAFVNIKPIESTTYAFYAASNAASFELTC